MNNINWKLRFSFTNKAFLTRVAVGVLIPLLGYFGLKFEDLTTWQAVQDVFVKAISNPYVLGLCLVNVLNLVPDPTTKGFRDSKEALEYEVPKVSK